MLSPFINLHTQTPSLTHTQPTTSTEQIRMQREALAVYEEMWADMALVRQAYQDGKWDRASGRHILNPSPAKLFGCRELTLCDLPGGVHWKRVASFFESLFSTQQCEKVFVKTVPRKVSILLPPPPSPNLTAPNEQKRCKIHVPALII